MANLEELNKYRSDWNIDKKRSNANFNCMSFSIINFKMNDKELNLDSPNCKSSKKQILNNIAEIEKITFRDLEGFMKVEKIKYYK